MAGLKLLAAVLLILSAPIIAYFVLKDAKRTVWRWRRDD